MKKFDLKMDGLTLSVTSVKRSLKFYTKVLGFKCEIDSSPDFGMVRVGGPKGPTIGLLPLKWAVTRKMKKVSPAMTEGAHLEFSTRDLDALYKKLGERGVQFDGPPEEHPWGERSVYACDPDGYVIEFSQA